MKIKHAYGNIKVYHPDGTLMFICNNKKADWYLKNNLAILINEKDIKLTFEPKGKGQINEYFLTEKNNCCVVCGEENVDELEKHHIVPKEYRMLFPLEYKGYNCHEVVLICTKHHREYENKYAVKLKNYLAEKYDAPKIHGLSSYQKDLYKIKKLSKLLINPPIGIPKKRIYIIKNDLKNLLNVERISKKILNDIINSENISEKHHKVIVSKIQNFDEFIKIWREDFVNNMKPKFMPIGWKIENPVIF